MATAGGATPSILDLRNSTTSKVGGGEKKGKGKKPGIEVLGEKDVVMGEKSGKEEVMGKEE